MDVMNLALLIFWLTPVVAGVFITLRELYHDGYGWRPAPPSRPTEPFGPAARVRPS